MELFGGADANALNEQGFTPLHLAANSGDVDTATVLIGAGAKVNGRQKEFGLTPLHVAALNGHEEMVRQLLSYGAKADIVADGETPLTIAKAKGFGRIAGILEDAMRQSRKWWQFWK